MAEFFYYINILRKGEVFNPVVKQMVLRHYIVMEGKWVWWILCQIQATTGPRSSNNTLVTSQAKVQQLIYGKWVHGAATPLAPVVPGHFSSKPFNSNFQSIQSLYCTYLNLVLALWWTSLLAWSLSPPKRVETIVGSSKLVQANPNPCALVNKLQWRRSFCRVRGRHRYLYWEEGGRARKRRCNTHSTQPRYSKELLLGFEMGTRDQGK